MKSIAIYREPIAPCHYLPHESMQSVYGVAEDLQPRMYAELLRTGWRRLGPVIFRPDCPSCRKCLSLRLPVASFQPSRTQRRTWIRSAGDVVLEMASPSLSAERVALYRAFHEHGHVTKGWPDRSTEITEDGAPGLDLFLNNPFPTEEWSYWAANGVAGRADATGTLLGVGYVDVMPDGLSAIYFFHNPAEHRRSLGTLNILHLIEAARQRGLPYVYLGYYVEGCRSLEYKARFRPNEVFVDGKWVALLDARP